MKTFKVFIFLVFPRFSRQESHFSNRLSIPRRRLRFIFNFGFIIIIIIITGIIHGLNKRLQTRFFEPTKVMTSVRHNGALRGFIYLSPFYCFIILLLFYFSNLMQPRSGQPCWLIRRILELWDKHGMELFLDFFHYFGFILIFFLCISPFLLFQSGGRKTQPLALQCAVIMVRGSKNRETRTKPTWKMEIRDMDWVHGFIIGYMAQGIRHWD